MKRTPSRAAALCGIILLLINIASAQNPQNLPPGNASPVNADRAKPDKATNPRAANSLAEVEMLKRRIEDVENQNRVLMQMVTELKTRLDASKQPEEKKENL